MVLLPTLLAARRGSGTMKALTPAGLTRARQVSPLTPLCLPDIPTPTTRAAQRSLCQSPQRHRLLPGFATNEQARHRSTPNQVRHPTDCRFISGCSPPRLTATQLPSITEPTTGSDTDFHHANRASSRSALVPAKAGIQEPQGVDGRPGPQLSRGQRVCAVLHAWAARRTARKIAICVPQRHLRPESPSRICCSEGCGLSRNKAAAVMIQPLRQ